MSAVALATVGYICPGGIGAIKFGEGPPIVSSDSLAPTIDAAGVGDPPPSPTIIGAANTVPVIRGASESPTTPPAGAPSIIGGGNLVPNIDGGEEV